MGILFVIALFLAWPTFGLSIIFWFVLFFLKAKGNTNSIERREQVKELIEPLFEDEFSNFFFELNIPVYDWEEMSEAEAHQCGRHIMNYIAHNPTETSEFLRGLQKWRIATESSVCSPSVAADCENRFNKKGEIHAVSYRAVEALMTNNKIPCFKKVDLAGVIKKRAMLEIDQLFPKST